MINQPLSNYGIDRGIELVRPAWRNWTSL